MRKLQATGALITALLMSAAPAHAQSKSLRLLSEAPPMPTVESSASISVMNVGSPQRIAVAVVPQAAPITFFCSIGSRSGGKGTLSTCADLGAVPSGGILTVQITLIAPSGQAPTPTEFEMVLVAEANGATISVKGATPGFQAAQAPPTNPPAVTRRSKLGQEQCLDLGIRSAGSFYVEATAQAPDGTAVVTISSSECLPRDEVADDPNVNLFIDAEPMGSPGTWKVKFDPDSTGPLQSIEVTVHRRHSAWYAVVLLFIGSAAASLIAWGALEAMKRTKKSADSAKIRQRVTKAKLKVGQALLSYPTVQPRWPGRLATAVKDLSVEDEEADLFVSDSSSVVSALAVIPQFATIEFRRNDQSVWSGAEFAAEVEAALISLVRGTPANRQFGRLTQQLEVTLRVVRSAKQDFEAGPNQAEIVAALEGVTDGVPGWPGDSLKSATNELAARMRRPGIRATDEAEETSPPDLATTVQELEDADEAASENLKGSKLYAGSAILIAATIGLVLAITSGMATQYFPNDAWGSRADELAALTWSISATGVVQAARLIGVGLSPVTIK